MFNVGDLVTARLAIGWDGETEWKMAVVREVKSHQIVVQVVGFYVQIYGGMGDIEEWKHPDAMYQGRTMPFGPMPRLETKKWPTRTRYTMLEVL